MGERLNAAIRGLAPFDLVLTDVQVVNVFTEEILAMDVAIHDGRFAHLAAAGTEPMDAVETRCGDGAFLVPGFVDCHLHIESSMLTPRHFAEAALPHGSTTVVIDPHELANVLGMEAVRYMAEAGKDLPMDILVEVPSSVPAVPGLETSGATFGGAEVDELLQEPNVIGLAEVMDFPGVIRRSPRMQEVLGAAQKHGTVISGHAPMVTGRDLSAYLAEGPNSDHETMTAAEVLEKLRAGMVVEARRSSHSENISLLAAVLKDLPTLPPNIVFCTDDVLPNDLIRRGHMNEVVRSAVAQGIAPARAIRIAALHGAQRFRLWDRGAAAPGMRADFSLVNDLQSFEPHSVYVEGREVAANGAVTVEFPQRTHAIEERHTVKTTPIRRELFTIPVPPESSSKLRDGFVAVHGMQISEIPLLTEHAVIRLPYTNGELQLPSDEDVAWAAVLERHGRHGGVGRTVIRGLGLSSGALATTVAHDSHNLLVVGKSAADMELAAQTLVNCGGGAVYCRAGKVVALVELPVGGLMSRLSAWDLAPLLDTLQQALRDAGIVQADPLMAFLPLSLPVIPEVRITDKGLVDIVQQTLYPVYA